MSMNPYENPAMAMRMDREAALKLAAENPLLANDPVTKDFLFKGGVVNGKEEDMGQFLIDRLAKLEAEAAEAAVTASGYEQTGDVFVQHSERPDLEEK